MTRVYFFQKFHLWGFCAHILSVFCPYLECLCDKSRNFQFFLPEIQENRPQRRSLMCFCWYIKWIQFPASTCVYTLMHVATSTHHLLIYLVTSPIIHHHILNCSAFHSLIISLLEGYFLLACVACRYWALSNVLPLFLLTGWWTCKAFYFYFSYCKLLTLISFLASSKFSGVISW